MSLQQRMLFQMLSGLESRSDSAPTAATALVSAGVTPVGVSRAVGAARSMSHNGTASPTPCLSHTGLKTPPAIIPCQMGSFCIFLAKRCSSRSFQALPWLIWVYRIYLPFLLWPSVSYSCRSCLQSETYSICGCVVFFSPFERVLENFWDILTVFLLSPHRDLFFLSSELQFFERPLLTFSTPLLKIS